MRSTPNSITVPLSIASVVLLLYWITDAIEISRGTVLATDSVTTLYVSMFLTAIASTGLLAYILLGLKAEKRRT
ncbi:MAG: hypothetical protein JRN15_22905 [Nitrososphaerota archaeon]|nr:hypothetical protein [Nitrososphaerota archaeon]